MKAFTHLSEDQRRTERGRRATLMARLIRDVGSQQATKLFATALLLCDEPHAAALVLKAMGITAQ